MPFKTPPLDDWRKRGRDYVLANLPVRGALLPNSPMRVMSDNSAGMSYMVMLFLAELAEQLLPDTAQGQWLKRHASIELVDGVKGATFASGTVNLTGIVNTFVPAGFPLVARAADGTSVQLEVTADTTIGGGDTAAPVRALTAGSAGNFDEGAILAPSLGLQGLDARVTVVSVTGGADAETDDELRVRVVDKIQKPPMGGDADDYVAWALEVPGVTRAWASPNEMGIGTVTVRFMCDDLRATHDSSSSGFPLPQDVAAVQAHIDLKRPVTVKDFFVAAPVPEPVNFTLSNLDSDDASTRAAISASVSAMLKAKAAPAFALNGVAQPAQTIYAAWVSDAVLNTTGVEHFDLVMSDHVMPMPGSMAILGAITRA